MKTLDGDDSEFIARVERVVSGLVQTVEPAEYYVVRVDNWFGDRWLRFSGKVLGAVGVRMRQLTIPPFVPSRLASGTFFRRCENTGKYKKIRRPSWLHPRQRSGQNLQNRVELRSPYGLFLWFSGHSDETGQAALMSYVPSPEGHWPWYAAFSRQPDWTLVKSIGITPDELRQIETSGREAAA